MGANNNPGLSQVGGLGDLSPPPVFGRKVNPISTRGAHYAHHSTTRPPKILGACDGPAIKQLCYNFGKYNQTQGLLDEVLG